MKEQSGKIYCFADFRLDADNRQLRRDDKPLSLPPKAFDLLLTLVKNKGRLVEKDELFNSVWRDQIVEESNLTVHISQIRKALGETRKNPRFIETVPGYGYRFVGEVTDLENGDEIFIETETLSRITIEQEVSDTNARQNGAVQNNLQTRNQELEYKAQSSKTKNQKSYNSIFRITAVGVFVISFAALSFYFWNAKKSNLSFEKIKLTRLTNNGKISAARLSPDGKFIAYVLGEAEGSSLWVRQTGAANDMLILPPVKAEFWGLNFSPDGTQIYYNLFAGDKTDVELFRIPTFGGAPQKIPNVIAHSISFSPDGKRFAYIQADSASNHNYLLVADADGSNPQVIAKKPQPNTFIFDGDFTAWSPDGETIACLIHNLEAQSNYDSIVGVNVRNGTEKPLTARKWHGINSFKWLRDGSGLLVSGKEKGASRYQIWFVSQPDGEIRPVTDDVNNYSWLSVGADGASLIALQTVTVNGIFVGEPGDENSFQEIHSEVGSLTPLAWMPDGKIVYRSSADGVSNFWTINADGTNRRQLTAGAQADERGMCVTPDGKFIVFVSWRSGKSNLWITDADGINLRQLTDGEADAYPQCSPDGKSVIFQRGILSQPRLWKVLIDGGATRQLTVFDAKWGAISNDGRSVSFLQMFENKWSIGIISSDGGAVFQRLDVPAALRENETRWSPDNRSLYFIATNGSVGNVWSLPLEGGEIKRVTDFKSRYLEDFAWSADATKLAVARSSTVSDAILIERAE